MSSKTESFLYRFANVHTISGFLCCLFAESEDYYDFLDCLFFRGVPGRTGKMCLLHNRKEQKTSIKKKYYSLNLISTLNHSNICSKHHFPEMQDTWDCVIISLERMWQKSYKPGLCKSLLLRSSLDTILILWDHLVILRSQKDTETRRPLHCQSYSSLFMRQVCFPICMVVRSVELVSTSRTSSCRSSSVSASRARFFSCSSICKYGQSRTFFFFVCFFKGIKQQSPCREQLGSKIQNKINTKTETNGKWVSSVAWWTIHNNICVVVYRWVGEVKNKHTSKTLTTHMAHMTIIQNV